MKGTIGQYRRTVRWISQDEWNKCTRKIGYAYQEDAQAICDHENKRLNTYMTIYHCKYCTGWHYGHE